MNNRTKEYLKRLAIKRGADYVKLYTPKKGVDKNKIKTPEDVDKYCDVEVIEINERK